MATLERMFGTGQGATFMGLPAWDGSPAPAVLLGGDDSLPIPMLQALEPQGPLTVLQIDAHIDWREEVEGERWGLSSTMRCASEMPHVERIIQVGQRGIGSARPSDVRDALDWGVHFVPASAPDLVATALSLIPEGANVALCLDWDALDPSIMPAVIGRTAGGLSFHQALALIEGANARANLRALDFTEFMPSRDLDGLGATTAAQLVAAALGCLAR